MITNLELKAKIASPSRTLRIAKRIAQPCGLLKQTDTYYNVRKGRLKLREFSKGEAELIYYNRNEKKDDRWSHYQVFPVKNAAALKKILTDSLGSRVTVKKKRRLFLYKKARIHIDNVSGLGNFVEFEVIVGREKELAKSIYKELIKIFKIQRKNIIQCSYSDLIRQKK